MAAFAKRSTRDCSACGRKYACVWEIDSWVCRFITCGAEWPPTPGDDEYADPSGEIPDDATFGGGHHHERDSWDDAPDAEGSLL